MGRTYTPSVGSVTTAMLADGAVTNAKIVDAAAIPISKLAGVATSTHTHAIAATVKVTDADVLKCTGVVSNVNGVTGSSVTSNQTCIVGCNGNHDDILGAAVSTGVINGSGAAKATVLTDVTVPTVTGVPQ